MLTEILPVKLTDTEIRERGQKLAAVRLTIADEEATKKAFSDAHKERVGGLEQQSYELARAIRSGQEDREVQVEEQKDYKAQEVRTIRLDTSEVVHRRAMTPRELQRPLPIEPEKKKGRGSAEAGA